MKPEFVDFMGQRITMGDVIVYPVRRGSDMALKKATVCEVPGQGCVVKMGIVALNPNGRRVNIQKPERCVVVGAFNDRRP
jgi:hypothetical protein